MPITLARPTDPAAVVAVLDYLWTLAPVTMDDAYAHVRFTVNLWVNGEDDPYPDPPPDDKGHRPAPPPDPPPMPAYPLAQLLEALCALDVSSRQGDWMAVSVALDDWRTSAS